MRNHYIPQFLLKQWATENDKKIEVFRKDVQGIPSHRKAPAGTGYENDLYALSRDRIAGMDKHAIEKSFLMVVDNSAAKALKKIHDHGLKLLSSEERQDWTRFLMSLRLRQPEIIQSLVTESANELHRNLSEQPEEYEKLRGENDELSLPEWTEKTFPGLIENFGLSFFHELVDNEEVGTKILKMNWWIWNFSNCKNELLLADHPCIFSHGIDDDNLIIALPIGPRKAFLATQSSQVEKILRLQKPCALLARLNESSINQSRVRIYATNKLPRRFIENRLR